ncbi:MAG: cbb3-type cytochrome c oxidase subunit I [Acidobacteriota bacterium]
MTAQSMVARDRLALSNLAVSLVAFALGAVMAVMQSLSRADLDVVFRSPKVYYLSVTAHGVLMGLVFTTFFIMALGIVFVRQCLGRWVDDRWGWVAFGVALFGTLMTTAAILSGTSSVLYTFYPPMQAHPTFYIGATLLVVGSWVWCGCMIASVRVWQRQHRGKPLPLPVHGLLATVIVWLLATSGLAIEALGMLIPWSLGWVETIDPILARTYTWWFGHPLTYFWLLPAYVVWYTVLPRVAGGRLFSEPLTRLVFMLFVLFSTPVGLHHQLSDPGISSDWKLVHTFSTYVILFPSLVTAFTVIASLETAGRLRGRKGWLDWLKDLPWKDPLLVSVVLAMLTFALGGFGGAVNAAYAMNNMVHNTAWIMGHFHLTVGTAVALTFMGATYWLLPRLTDRPLALPGWALAQAYLWFVGMILFGVVNHITGILGMPRRVYSAEYFGAEQAARWQSWTLASAVGGVLLFVSSLIFLVVVVATFLQSRRQAPLAMEFARPLAPPATRRGLWDRFLLWSAVAVVLVVVGYYQPITHLLALERYGSLPFKPF